MIFPFLFILLLLLDTKHAQTTGFPFFEKEIPFVGKIENLFITKWFINNKSIEKEDYFNSNVTNT